MSEATKVVPAFRIVTAGTIEDLERAVQIAIDEGYQPHGAPFSASPFLPPFFHGLGVALIRRDVVASDLGASGEGGKTPKKSP